MRNGLKLITNQIMCKWCGDVITSKNVHDMVWCSCGTVAVDGGNEYAKRSFKYSIDDFLDLSEWE